MNGKEIIRAREKHTKLLILKEQYEELKERLNYYKNNTESAEYLELVQRLKELEQEFDFNETNLVSKAFEGIADKTTDPDHIWVDLGSYFWVWDSRGYRPHPAHILLAEFRIEKNLETCEERIIDYGKQTQEKPHEKTIFMKDFHSYNRSLREFEKIRIEYLEGLLTQPKKEVIRKMVKTY